MKYKYDAASIKYSVKSILLDYFRGCVGKKIRLHYQGFYNDAANAVSMKCADDIQCNEVASIELGKIRNWTRFLIESERTAHPVYDASKVNVFIAPGEFLLDAAASLAYEAVESVFEDPESTRLKRIWEKMYILGDTECPFEQEDYEAVKEALTIEHWETRGELINALPEFEF